MPSESPRESAFTTYTNEEVTGPPSFRTPVPDSFAKQFLPYRGSEFHGVDPGKVPVVADEDAEGGKAPSDYFVPPAPDIDPVPVRIVDTAIHEYKKWQTWQVQVGSVSPIMVAGQMDGRSNLRIRNFSTQGSNRVWIGPSSNVTSFTGFPLSGNDEVIFSGDAPVHAIADTGTVTLAVLVEYTVSE